LDSLDSPPPAKQKSPREEKLLTRRTGWQFVWDVKSSKFIIIEGKGGETWNQKVGAYPPKAHGIISCGGFGKAGGG
jgi:homoaconitate hydratase